MAAPEAYDESSYDASSYGKMAELIVNTTTEKFSGNILRRACGVAADGPYQATGFREKLLELLEIDDTSQLAFPVTWDPAHLLNLGVHAFFFLRIVFFLPSLEIFPESDLTSKRQNVSQIGLRTIFHKINLSNVIKI